jgi:hypothetical protein
MNVRVEKNNNFIHYRDQLEIGGAPKFGGQVGGGRDEHGRVGAELALQRVPLMGSSEIGIWAKNRLHNFYWVSNAAQIKTSVKTAIKLANSTFYRVQ